MYGIFAYIWLIFMRNVGKYTIHWSDGLHETQVFHHFHPFKNWVVWGSRLQVKKQLLSSGFPSTCAPTEVLVWNHHYASAHTVVKIRWFPDVQASQEEFEDDWDEADISDKKKVFTMMDLWDWNMKGWFFMVSV